VRVSFSKEKESELCAGQRAAALKEKKSRGLQGEKEPELRKFTVSQVKLKGK
jgi:hypothetical protein